MVMAFAVMEKGKTMSEYYCFGIREIRQNVYDSCYELFSDSDMANAAYRKIMGSLEDMLSEKEQEQEHE